MTTKRKQKVTNLKRQSWIMLRITIPTALILVVGIMVAIKYTRMSESNISNTINILDKSIQTESDMVSAFLQYAGGYRGNGIRLATGKIKKDHDVNISAIRESIPLIQKTISDMFFIVYILITAVIMQFIFLIFAIFKITNKMYGPVIIMEKVLKEAMEGKEPFKKELRKDDEFRSLYREIYRACGLIVPLIKKKHEQNNKEIIDNVNQRN